MKQIVIIGGGLAGLINAILLSRKGFQVTLYEKKEYPFHKVCGEYVSNEVVPFLEREGLLPNDLKLPEITKFQFTSIKGKSLELGLDLGGFGISRYYLDNFLKQRALDAGAEILERCSVTALEFHQNHFSLTLSNGAIVKSQFLIAAYGKRSKIDSALNRQFTKQRSPFIAVKYHIQTDFPRDKIALHNFQHGYCGISAIEDEKYNLCYLGDRDSLKAKGSISDYEENVLKENPFLKSILDNADFLFDRPEVINEFSFKPKKPVENHVLMSGDSAGLITPLCGNGMAMAIHSAYLLSSIIERNNSNGELNRKNIEMEYTASWTKLFNRRLWVGRKTQALFGSYWASELAARSMKAIPALARVIMKNSHGNPF